MDNLSIILRLKESCAQIVSIILTLLNVIWLLMPSASLANESDLAAHEASCRLAFEDPDRVSQAQHLRDKISTNFGVPFDVRTFSDPFQDGQASTLAPFKFPSANGPREPHPSLIF